MTSEYKYPDLRYGDEVWAWDNNCRRACHTRFQHFHKGFYNCFGELFDNAVKFDGGSDKVVEILQRKEN